MTTGKNKIMGLKKLLTKTVIVKQQQTRVSNVKKPAGEVLIKSEKLKDYVGEEARILIYVKRRK